MFLAIINQDKDILDIITPFKKKKRPRIKKIVENYKKAEQMDMFSYINLLEIKEDKELLIKSFDENDIDSINKYYVGKYKKTKDKKYLNSLIEKNQNLIFKVANKYKNKNIELQDLTQQGFLGFLKAVDKFDESKKVKFSTYAYYWIEAEISSFFNFNVDGSLSISSSYQHRKLKGYENGILSEDELPELVKNHIQLKNNSISVDSIVHGKENENSADYLLGKTDINYNNIESKIVMENALSGLSEKEKSIIISRIIYEKKYKDIAKEFKVSYQYIQYLYNNAIGKLKQTIKKDILV
ncbi:sigma-70 family RNA polymerase sigma factor [Clostridium botulinum]|uniref:sigma-70 family RNA polymerase sigma factor n=1 Tax=Clostridium botulinum TaxID=1491 RepID=UPI003DA3D835